MTICAAIAVLLASTSEVLLINGPGWMGAAIGAVCVTALAGSLTRLSPVPAAAGGTLCVLLASAPLLALPHWYGPVIAVLLAAACAARAARPRALQPFAAVATPLAALLLYLNAAFAHGQSLIGVVPTARSLRHLAALASRADSLLSNYGPPMPAGRPSIELLAAGGIGLVAIAVDLVAVRLRRPALAGVGLLVLFLAPITTNVSMDGAPSVIAFCLAATGYLAMLAADGRYRMRAFGHVVSVWHNVAADDAGSPDIKALAAAGRRIGLTAVCLAVAVPLLLPTLHFQRPDTGSGPNAVPATFPDPVVQLQDLLTRRHVTQVLTYTTTAPNASYQYLQIYVDNYVPAKDSWVLMPISAPAVTAGHGGLPAVPGLPAGTKVSRFRTSVTLGDVTGYDSGGSVLDFLPMPYPAVKLTAPGSWHVDPATLMVFGGSTAGLAGLSYQVVTAVPQLSLKLLNGPQLPYPAGMQQFLDFRSPVRARLRAIAQGIVRHAHARTAFAQAEALQMWFRSAGRFRYSTASKLSDTPSDLLRFLTVSRTGDCQQFAFSMAALARVLGIPARVAVGFTGGTHVRGDRWQVTTADAHAWPELWFRGAGWLRFEPTPSSGGQATAQLETLPVSQSQSTTPPSTRLAVGHKRTTPPQVSKGVTGPIGPAPSVRPQHPAGRTDGGPLGLPLLVLAVVLIAAAAVPRITRLVVRSRRWHAAADDAGLARAAYLEVTDDLGNYGFASRSSESPRMVARRVAADSGLAEPASMAMKRIARVVERARYAPEPPAAGSVRADVAIVRRGLARSASLPVRCRAALLPASVLQPVLGAVRNRAQVFGWADASSRRSARGMSLG